MSAPVARRIANATAHGATALRRLVSAGAARLGSRSAVLSAMAIVIGLATGLLAAALFLGISWARDTVFDGTAEFAPSVPIVVGVPTIGGLLVGLLVWRLVPEARGSGISQLMEAIALRGGHVRGRVVGGKLAASAVGLGTGGSGGREGPVVQIGGAVGSLLGRAVDTDEDETRSLIAAGAAGGIAASFNAPIGGMLFALEVILGRFGIRHLQTVVLAAVVASVTARQILGEQLIYRPPAYSLGEPQELLLYGLLGLVAVIVGVGYVRAIALSERLAAQLPMAFPLRTALGGLGVGLLALAVPEVLGTGDRIPDVAGGLTEPVAAMFSGAVAPTMLLTLLAAKFVATCLSLGTGNAVGSFGPLLFLGAALGGAFGHGAQVLIPTAEPGAFALAGTAAVIAAASRAPLTGALLVFELTGSYDLVLPIILAAGVATVLGDRVFGPSLYTEPLRRRGITYEVGEDVDVLQTVTVREVMNTDPDIVTADTQLPDLREWFRDTRHHGAPVVTVDDSGTHRLVGVVTLTDIAGADEPGPGRLGDTGDIFSMSSRIRELTAADICTRDIVTVTPEAPIYRAVQRMAALDVGRLPVVDRRDPERLLGLVRRADIVRAYRQALQRSLGESQRRQRSRLRDLAGARFSELVVAPDSSAAGRRVSEVDWPAGTVLTSVRRGDELIVPNGDTVLEAGDELVALQRSGSTAELWRLVGPPPDRP
ncbi:CBS domain-containing protein [Egibacter rhizosphaerae]|uniref:CBS domain-containing protein n=1 Tax=Egibacter rhizosphaerae TaxID=1670831 RepID=A0A411YE11_9ACTN|nr:chloride channel protein [Egibacter rhizosphaerae]QBI19445.1 CBS domain-containing protein [Egibacter rhizosphaerae]